MSPEIIFDLNLAMVYVVRLFCTGAYIFPKLNGINAVDAQRAIAILHSFRFVGLVLILPGVVGHNLPLGFATFAAWGDFATGILATLALFSIRIRSLLWLLVVTFNLVRAADLAIDYYHGVKYGLEALSGELGAAYAIVILYVPLLTITHFIAFRLMVRNRSKSVRAFAGAAITS